MESSDGNAGGSPATPQPARGVLERVRELLIRLLQPRASGAPTTAVDDTAGLSVVELIAGGHVPEAVVEHLRSENDRARVAQEAMLRAIADGEDARRRLTEQKEQAVRFANETLLKEMLPVLDNLEISLQHSDAETASPLREAIEMTLRQWYSVFERAGAVRIDAERGGEFDPSVHEVVMDEPDAVVPKGSIARIVQTGLRFHDRLLRPTRVSLSTGAPAIAPMEVAATPARATPGEGATEGAASAPRELVTTSAREAGEGRAAGEASFEPPAVPEAKAARATVGGRPAKASGKGRKKAKPTPRPKPRSGAGSRPKKVARSRQRSTRSRAGRK